MSDPKSDFSNRRNESAPRTTWKAPWSWWSSCSSSAVSTRTSAGSSRRRSASTRRFHSMSYVYIYTYDTCMHARYRHRWFATRVSRPFLARRLSFYIFLLMPSRVCSGDEATLLRLIGFAGIFILIVSCLPVISADCFYYQTRFLRAREFLLYI